jgi:hypothetical protein
MDFISVEKLIKILKEKNISFGKGDPYNRLRYYTKIGWLPHMTRKKNEEGVISGHYPTSVIQQIETIESLKKEGKSNDEIEKMINNTKYNKNEISILEKFKAVNINYLFVFIIIVGIILELIKYNSHSEKIISPSIQENNEVTQEKKIIDSGISFIPKNQSIIFVPSSRVTPISIILLNFYNNLGYNNNYFIREIKPTQGFYIETNYPVTTEVKFNWVIIQ